MFVFLLPAYAQSSAPAQQGGLFGLLMPLILIFAVFYFFVIRPQNVRYRRHAAMLAALERGDSVVTGGGVIGQVVRVLEREVVVRIADGVEIKVVKTTIADVNKRSAS